MKRGLNSGLSETTAAFKEWFLEASQDLDSVKQQRLAQEDELLRLREQIDRATKEHQVNSVHLYRPREVPATKVTTQNSHKVQEIV